MDQAIKLGVDIFIRLNAVTIAHLAKKNHGRPEEKCPT
jgi:hypothetical protein